MNLRACIIIASCNCKGGTLAFNKGTRFANPLTSWANAELGYSVDCSNKCVCAENGICYRHTGILLQFYPFCKNGKI